MNKTSRMRKVVTLVLLFALIWSISVVEHNIVNAQSNNTIIIEKNSKQEDGKIIVNINLTKNSGLAVLGFTVIFPQNALTYLSYQKGDALSGMVFTPPGQSSPTAYPSFLWDNLGTDSNDSSTGVILTLSFEINHKIPFQIGIKDVSAQTFDKEYKEVEIKTTGLSHSNEEAVIDADKILIFVIVGLVIVLAVAVVLLCVFKARKRRN